MNKKLIFKSISTISLILSLLACTSPSVNNRPVDIEDRTTVEVAQESSPATVAAREYARGEYSSAGSLFQQLADGSESEQVSQDFHLRAADAYARAGGHADAAAREELKHLNVEYLNSEQRLLYKIIGAQIAVNEARARDAFALIPREAANASNSTQVRLGMVRSDAWLGLRRTTDAVLERIDIDPLITNQEERALNHQWIWNQLQNMPSDDIFSPPSGMTQSDAGWWSLAAIVKKGTNQNSGYDQNELAVWKSTYPRHPATEDILFFIEGDPTAPVSNAGYYSRSALDGVPTNVALLLPLSGHYAHAGQSILNGFRDAANSSAAGNVNYQVYDAADVSHSLADIAHHAVRSGAEMIIGPLQKTAISDLLAAGNMGVPILALNTLPNGQAGYEGLFQFGLSPENEAVEVAERAISDGRYRTVVLASADTTGERIANAFMSAFEQAGGRVVAYNTFDPKSNTISQVMKKLLRAGSPDPLWEDVRKGTDRISNDDQHIDMIFFTASARDSRIIRPLVQLHRAFDLPVYSSARIYAHPDSNMDKDLDGLIFCDMPSRIAGNISTPQLTALGLDAYLLVNQLHYLSSDPGSQVSGETGRLSVTQTGQIWRHLDCATFNRGVPKILP